MFPKRILLATDLTSRSDRALDRSLQLMGTWQAELHVVHAIRAASPTAPLGTDPARYLQRHPPQRDAAMRLLRRDIDVDALGAFVHVEENVAPATAILDVAARERCDLIVLGQGRQRMLGPVVESTTEIVLRKSPVSVLVVRDRARRHYGKLLVGTDFTDEAQQALVYAAELFGDASIMLMHAFSTPYSSFMDGTAESRDWPIEHLAKLRKQIEDAALSVERKASILHTLTDGPPGAMMRQYVNEQEADLVVIGAHPRGVLFDTVVGNSRRIVEAVPGDLLMVRATRSEADTAD